MVTTSISLPWLTNHPTRGVKSSYNSISYLNVVAPFFKTSNHATFTLIEQPKQYD